MIILGFVISEEDYLAHYGRKGMKWYQHIFGDKKSNGSQLNKNKSRDIKERVSKNIYNALTHPYSTIAKSAVTAVKGKNLVDLVIFHANLGAMRVGHHLKVAAQIPQNPMAIAFLLSGLKYDKNVYNYNKEKYKERKKNS